MKNKISRFPALSLAAVAIFTILNAQGTAFTYQAKLSSGGNPANSSYDLKFSLYDASASGNQAGGSLSNADTV